MKKALLVFAVLMTAFVTVSAADNVTKKFDNTGFIGLDIKDAFSVELTKSDVYRVEVSVPEEYIDYVSVTQSGGKLSIGFKDLPRKMKSFKSMKGFEAKISMPELNLLEMTGSSRITTGDMFVSEMRGVEMAISGSSKVISLNLKAPSVSLKLSGSSKVTMDISTSDFSTEISGASKLELTGEATDARIDLSGASSVDAEQFANKNVTLDQSGASRCNIFIGDKFTVEVSGASKCVYYANGKIDLDVSGITGASTFKRGEKK